MAPGYLLILTHFFLPRLFRMCHFERGRPRWSGRVLPAWRCCTEQKSRRSPWQGSHGSTRYATPYSGWSGMTVPFQSLVSQMGLAESVLCSCGKCARARKSALSDYRCSSRFSPNRSCPTQVDPGSRGSDPGWQDDVVGGGPVGSFSQADEAQPQNHLLAR
jgi:hypothetical protein